MGVAEVVEQLDNVLAFNDLLVSLKERPEADQFARGVGPVSLVGRYAVASTLFPIWPIHCVIFI